MDDKEIEVSNTDWFPGSPIFEAQVDDQEVTVQYVKSEGHVHTLSYCGTTVGMECGLRGPPCVSMHKRALIRAPSFIRAVRGGRADPGRAAVREDSGLGYPVLWPPRPSNTPLPSLSRPPQLLFPAAAEKGPQPGGHCADAHARQARLPEHQGGRPCH